MRLTTLATLAMMAPFGSAHYYFDKLIIEGKESNSKEFVRGNTRKVEYMPTKWIKGYDNITPDSTDFRCNKGAFTSAAKTKTAEVKAGSKLAMKLALKARMEHPGPAFVYMAKAPTTAKAFEGDGDWFKIFEEGVCNPNADLTTNAWCTWGKDNIAFTIPKETPDGEYLVRAEHVGLHGAHVGEVEFYYECAQIKVTGGGNGKPGPTVKFPGAYKKDDKSFTFSIYGGSSKSYPMPDPPVWGGGGQTNKGGGGGGGGGGGSSGRKTPGDTKNKKNGRSFADGDEATANDAVLAPRPHDIRKRADRRSRGVEDGSTEEEDKE